MLVEPEQNLDQRRELQDGRLLGTLPKRIDEVRIRINELKTCGSLVKQPPKNLTFRKTRKHFFVKLEDKRFLNVWLDG